MIAKIKLFTNQQEVSSRQSEDYEFETQWAPLNELNSSLPKASSAGCSPGKSTKTHNLIFCSYCCFFVFKILSSLDTYSIVGITDAMNFKNTTR